MHNRVVIVGAGIAGLMTALKLAPLPVLVLSKAPLGSGTASDWAQGGIAAAVGADDSPDLHGLDTRRAGAGLSEGAIVDILTRDAPARIAELVELGAAFDRTEDGMLKLGREAAHNRRRIVKAGGDATGHAILKTLIAASAQTTSITIREHTIVDDLIVEDGAIRGTYAHDARTGEAFAIPARATVLATGGLGRVYRYTTNPAQATGDGVAVAARAGAVLADMEFVQFHPTALAVARDPLPLVTEAIRGEGAILRNDLGERFMLDEHPDAELAPRDIVARAIFFQQRAGRTVSLDAREAIGRRIDQRFPTVFRACMQAGIDPRRVAIPVTPAAHYAMGGVAADAWGRTSLPGLWACGETGATGVHGANRLASNSLLEALVYATRVATDISCTPAAVQQSAPLPHDHRIAPESSCAQAVADLRSVMYANVGLIRYRAGLQAARARMAEIDAAYSAQSNELRNLLAIGDLIARAAIARKESRGSHYRSDYPRPHDAFAKRSFSILEVA